MKERAGKKKVVLELGGNAGVIVDKTADLDWAVKRGPRRGVHATPARSASASSGCSSTRTSGTRSWTRFVEGAKALKVGDPLDPTTDVGPMVDAARRRRGPSAGSTRRSRWAARSSLGGKADGTFFPPTILTDVPIDRPGLLERGVRAARRRVPVPRPRRRDRARSTTRSSASRPASSPTTSAGAWQAFDELEVGGVIVNDVPTYRIDHMPYGGVKDSGLGREGLRWAIEDMTEIRIMVLAQPS